MVKEENEEVIEMDLTEPETIDMEEVMAIIQELMGGEPEIQKQACDKLWSSFGEVGDEEAAIILKALNDAFRIEKRKTGNAKLLQKVKVLLKNYEKGNSPEKRKKILNNLEERRTKNKIKRKQKKELEKINKRKEEIRLFKESRLQEEKVELRNYTYFSKEAKRRLPVLSTIKTILRFASALYLLAGFMAFFIFLDVIEVGMFILGICITLAIQSLLLAELLTFLLDFHDTNHTNTNVRIKTLKVLEKINENLKK